MANVIEHGLVGSLIGPSLEDFRAASKAMKAEGFTKGEAVLAGMAGGLYWYHEDGRVLRMAPLPKMAGSIIEIAPAC